MMVNGSSGEGIHNVMRVLSEPGTARVMLAQATRAPFADRNGREKTVSGGKGTDGDEPETMADLRRIVAEQANTITQLRKTQDPGKFQRRTAYKGQRKGQDGQHQSTQDTRPPRKRVQVPEGRAQQSSIHPTIPGKAQANMLRTSRATSDSDEEPDRSPACCVRARTKLYDPNEKIVPIHEASGETDGVHLQEVSHDQIKYGSPELESGKYYVMPFGSLAGNSCKIVWKNDQSAKE